MESLFEKAGYMKYRDGSDGHNIIYKSLSDENRLIIFMLNERLIETGKGMLFSSKIAINMDELKAIMHESVRLGWISMNDKKISGKKIDDSSFYHYLEEHGYHKKMISENTFGYLYTENGHQQIAFNIDNRTVEISEGWNLTDAGIIDVYELLSIASICSRLKWIEL